MPDAIQSTTLRACLAKARLPVPDAEPATRFELSDLVGEARRAGLDDAARETLTSEDVAGLVAHLAHVSPFLTGLIRRDPARLLWSLDGNPDHAFETRLLEFRAEADATEPNKAGLQSLTAAARRMKADAALFIALADMTGAWSVDRVIAALSDLADATLQAGVRQMLRMATARGEWTPVDAGAPEFDGGYFILAMGKHGARELNYSSDIDLIVFYDRDRCRLADVGTAQAFFVRLTHGLVKYMSERTVDGYVFRVDLRLRPDPGATQVAMSTDAALQYYESFGQNWERAAMIKARPVAGDLAAGSAFLDELSPYIWRKYLDFASIADIHAMKRQIHAHRGHARIAIAGHDIKVGRGGIREIEFFAQTQQLIAGGRQPELRVPQTLTALDLLVERRWIKPGVRDDLHAAYRFLRTIEHRVQMTADEQTQRLPSDDVGLTRLAAFSGFADLEAFRGALTEQLETVQRHYVDLFEEGPDEAKADSNLVFIGEDNDPETVAKLTEMGFKDPGRAINLVRSWHRGRYRAVASKVTRERLTALQPVLLEALSETVDPDFALVGFDRLLGQLPAGVQLFSLLHAHPRLLRLVADITGSAPRLARTLARRRRVLDVVLDPGELEAALPDDAALGAMIARDVGGAESLEEALDRARGIGAEQAFLIGVRVLAGSIDAGAAGLAYARLAEVLIAALHERVSAVFETDHGRVAGRGSAAIAMGKLGGREMTAASDLDLIVIYDADPDAKASSGPRDLAVSQYFARLTQRLISALSAPTAEGTLYEVDLRLRPSGQKGPVATRFDSFRSYQESEAWTWEHMALTRARVIAGPPELTTAIEGEIKSVLCRPRDPVKIATDVREMRDRIAAEKGTSDIWDLKQVRGGLVDLEFIAQYLQLVHAARHPEILDQTTRTALHRLDAHGLLGPHGETLIEAADLIQALTQLLRLCFDGRFEPESAPDGLKRRLADAAGLPDFNSLEAELRRVQGSVAEIFDEIVAPNA